MKEIKPGLDRLTRTPAASTLRSERSFMAEGTTERLTPEKADEKLSSAAKRREVTAGITELLAKLPPDTLEALRKEMTGHSSRGAMGERDEEGLESTKALVDRNKNILLDIDYREEYFNKLFKSTYAFPHKSFNEIFSPWFGPGKAYVDFINLIEAASVDELPDYVSYDPRYASKTDKEKENYKDQLKKDLIRYQKEEQVIAAIHDASRVLFYPSVDAKSYTESIQQFDSLGGDVAFRTPGVNQMMNIIENVLRETMAKNDGFLPPEAISGKVKQEKRLDAEGKVVKIVKEVNPGDVEETVKQRYREWVKNQLVVARSENGEAFVTNDLREPKDWEINRTFSIARGMMLIDSRLISILAESNQPEGSAQYASQFLQDILQGWSSFQHLTGKYGLTRKDMSLLLFKDENIKKVLGLSIWEPKDLEKILKRYEKDPRSILESSLTPEETFYIMRENPLKAGDIFTWISWRLNPDSKKGDPSQAVESMVKDFMDNGRKRMQDRIERGIKPAGVSAEDYLKEYENWIGTGVRFEKLRGEMALIGEDPKIIERRDKAIKKGKDILKKMSELQGYRLYSLSRLLRDRVATSLGMDQNQIDQALKNLSMVEAALLKSRETLLENGKTFDKVSLNDFFSVINNEKEREEAKRFAKVIAKDFETNPEEYYDEFIYKREYRHGFVLWSGDSPVDEFNFSRLAATGGFARRARDNQHQGAAGGKILEFMGSLKHVHEMDKIFEGMKAIHDEIALYDPAKADQTIADLAQGIIKFYSERSTTKIPIYGQLERFFGNKVSYAKIVHGKGSMAWSSSQAHTFIDHLENLNYITKEQAEALMEKVPAGKLDFYFDAGVTLSQLIIFWLMGYLAEKVYRGK